MKPCMTLANDLAKFALVGACAVMLTACVSSQMPISPAQDDVDAAPPPPTVEPNGSGNQQAAACNLDAIQYAIGEPFDEAAVSQLQSDSSARQVRVLRPGDMATMDHRPDRLNIHLNDQDVIEEVRCG
ncbi:I78 family peptidase inhibitor [Vreelandella neptunia]|uniref:I78 family peptidase inhibitor n=1 Tax=Vreelandella neptunia TaxID=115551 RepID=A0ABS9S8T9_9GAMM|nr:I78 family peptidase inhibitor [Halomonas neptunia]MCH4812515.1 I78 family peptidase inhibitor [Halomonas neptunia]